MRLKEVPYTLMGLSPRVRGNPNWKATMIASERSIPAGAGEPNRWQSTRGQKSVYPRGCGGTGGDVCDIQIVCGLSPRVRGNLPLGIA